MRISGAMKSFHAARNANSPTVIRPGLDRGQQHPPQRRRTTSSRRPCAASSSSRGTDSNEMRIMNVENGSWNIVSTRATPISEFCSPSVVEQHVQRDQQGRVRHHQDRQREQEQRVLAGEAEPRERVAAEQRDDQREHAPSASETNSELREVAPDAGLVVRQRARSCRSPSRRPGSCPGCGETDETAVQTSGNRKMIASAPVNTQYGVRRAMPASVVGGARDVRRGAGRVTRRRRVTVRRLVVMAAVSPRPYDGRRAAARR